jgi:Icc protein
MRIAHLSDLHFSKLTFGLGQFFSKRWLGNLNLLLTRKKEFATERLFLLPQMVKELGVTHLVVTGDLSTTSFDAELAQASELIKLFQELGIETFVIPGNHDHYTASSSKKKSFYNFFEPTFSAESIHSLREDRISVKKLGSGWWIVGLDTASAMPLISSQGIFSEELEQKLIEAISALPKSDRVILANHFPFFEQDPPRKRLIRAQALKKLIQATPQIKIYLHGHTHRHCIADLRPSGLPLVLDSGSTAKREGGTWNLIDLTPTACSIQPFRWQEELWRPLPNPTLFTW